MAVGYTGSGVGGAIQAGVDQWTPAKGELVRLDLVANDAAITALDTRVDTAETDIDALQAEFKVLRSITTLTNAENLALPTTPKTLIAAPGANKRIKLLAPPSLHLRNASGVYGNINTTYSSIAVGWNAGAWAATALFNDSSPVKPDVNNVVGTANPITSLTTFLNTISAGGGWIVELSPPYKESILDTSTALWIISHSGASFSGNNNGGVQGENKALELQADNNGSGNYTGGHASNTLRVTVYYCIEDMTP